MYQNSFEDLLNPESYENFCKMYVDKKERCVLILLFDTNVSCQTLQRYYLKNITINISISSETITKEIPPQ